MHLHDLGRDAPEHQNLQGPDQILIADRVIAPALEGGIHDAHRATVFLAHESGFLSAMRFIEIDQTTAQRRIENARQDDHGGRHFNAGVPLGRRQSIEDSKDFRDVGPILMEWYDPQDAHHRVDQHPDLAQRDGPMR